jgi:uncharacterized protein
VPADLPWTMIFVGLNGLIGFALSYIAVQARTRTGVWHGETQDKISEDFAARPAANPIAKMVEASRETAPDDGRLQRAVRAHGNFSEYVPLGLLFVLVLELTHRNVWLVIGVGTLLTLGRIIYSIGIIRIYGPSPWRFAGFMMTWAAYLIGSVACLYASFSLL